MAYPEYSKRAHNNYVRRARKVYRLVREWNAGKITDEELRNATKDITSIDNSQL